MQTSHKSHPEHFMRSYYDLSILISYILGLAVTVVLGAYGLEILSSIL